MISWWIGSYVSVRLNVLSVIRNENPKDLFVDWEQVGSAASDQHSKIPISNLWMNWAKLCPNLSFTFENKKGNLHKMGLFTFQV